MCVCVWWQCANCWKEAQFYCCWNTSYCGYDCQQAHWPDHMASCTQTSSSASSAAASAPLPTGLPQQQAPSSTVRVCGVSCTIRTYWGSVFEDFPSSYHCRFCKLLTNLNLLKFVENWLPAFQVGCVCTCVVWSYSSGVAALSAVSRAQDRGRRVARWGAGQGRAQSACVAPRQKQLTPITRWRNHQLSKHCRGQPCTCQLWFISPCSAYTGTIVFILVLH